MDEQQKVGAMNSRAMTLSLIIAGLAMFMVYSYIESERSLLTQQYGKSRPVVVAKVDIQEMELLDDRKVELMEVPEKFVSPQAISSKKEIYNTVATVPIVKGEQITKPRITYPGVRTGLSRQVASGKRAVSISVGEENAVSKLIKPGDRVDVLAFIDYAGGQKDKAEVKTVLQDILILSTGYKVTNELPMAGLKSDNEIEKLNLNVYENYGSLTLELSPFQAQKLIFLINSGAKYYLSLRNNDDKEMVRIQETKIFDLLDGSAAEARAYFREKNKKN